MPQVFGSGQLGLIAESSLWVEAGFLEDIEAHEGALAGAGFDQADLPVNLDTTGFHPRGSVWGQHLTSDKNHHTWVIARTANPETNPNARDTSVGGKPRYVAEVHKIPVNPQNTRVAGSVMPIWHGSDIRQFVNGQRRGPDDRELTWPQVQQAMKRGPGGR